MGLVFSNNSLDLFNEFPTHFKRVQVVRIQHGTKHFNELPRRFHEAPGMAMGLQAVLI